MPTQTRRCITLKTQPQSQFVVPASANTMTPRMIGERTCLAMVLYPQALVNPLLFRAGDHVFPLHPLMPKF